MNSPDVNQSDPIFLLQIVNLVSDLSSTKPCLCATLISAAKPQ